MLAGNRKKLLRIATLTVMALLLAMVAAAVMCFRHFTPQRLTPLFETYAASKLNARVEASRVELGLRAAYPFITLRIDSLVVLSADILALPEQERVLLPAGADTVVKADRVEAAINLLRMFAGGIDLRGVDIENMVLTPVKVREGLANYHLRRDAPDIDDDLVLDFDSLRFSGICAVDYLDISTADSALYVFPAITMSRNDVEYCVSQLMADIYMRRMLHSAKNGVLKSHDNE